MPRKIGPRDNFQVLITPRSLTDYGSIVTTRGGFGLYGYDEKGQRDYERDMTERCEQILADAKRHVDNFGHGNVVWDREDTCEFCGGKWTERGNDFNGGCCDEDLEAHEASKPDGEQVPA